MKINIINNNNRTSLWSELKESFQKHELIKLIFKRDLVSVYRQTILGPLWFVLTPIITTIVFTVIFGKIAKLPTDSTPPFLFYFSGIIIWTLFLNTVNKIANTYQDNADILSKIRFSKFTIFISSFLLVLSKFFIQYIIYISIIFYFIFTGLNIDIDLFFLVKLIFLIFYVFFLGLGLGMTILSLMIKYKDIQFIHTFFLNLCMYATPIVYPLSTVSGKIKFLFYLNPMTYPIEFFKHMHLGSPLPPIYFLMSNLIITLTIFIVGFDLYKRSEKTFIDRF